MPIASTNDETARATRAAMNDDPTDPKPPRAPRRLQVERRERDALVGCLRGVCAVDPRIPERVSRPVRR